MPYLADPEIDPPPDALPTALEAAIRAELEPGEEIAWIGRPVAWYISAADRRAGVNGLLVAALLTAWFVMIGVSGKIRVAGIGLTIIAPFLAVALIHASRPIRARSRNRLTGYVVTGERAIVFGPAAAFGHSIQAESSYPPRLREMRRVERRDGFGDLIFRMAPITHHGPAFGVEPRGFIAVAGVHEVERLVRVTLSIG